MAQHEIMPILEVTSLSTKGQVVIPNGDNILLKPIKAPRMSQFEKLIALGDKIGSELGLKVSDIEKAIKDVRKNADCS